MKINKSYIILLIVLLSCAAAGVRAQELKGTVMEWDEGMGMEMPVSGANVFWKDTAMGTAIDDDGNFRLPLPQQLPASLIISYVGYTSDTITVKDDAFKKILIKKSATLNEVIVEGRQNTLGISTINTINVEKVTEKELLKAACCNLSESFETNPTVTVAYRDAVTGAKEIQLLGLAGIYSQMLTENIPNMTGIAGIYGLSFIPGPWLESIQIAKGAGSVSSGYESTTGQINLEFKKPQEKKTPEFYLNLYGAGSGNAEINTFYKKKLSKSWSTIMMAHGNYFDTDRDRNDDGFKDIPHSKQLNFYNRWQYNGERLEAQVGLKYLYDVIHGGQVHPGNDNDVNPAQYYITSITTNRAEAFGKLGILFPEKPYKSIGNILQVTYHDMQSLFGLKNFDGIEKSLYYQSIYQSIVGTTDHQFKVGWSYKYDNYNQTFLGENSVMKQSVPGVFGEYTYSYTDKFTAIAGVREDYHNQYKWIFTPRLHMKYNFTETFIMRASGGKSFRVPYVLADNISVLASSRQLLFTEIIKPERAWNYGINFTKKFYIATREGSVNLDLYRTDFLDKLVVDQYSNPGYVFFYNLNGESYANSLQATVSYEIIPKLDLRLAYKTDDVQETYYGVLEQKPLVPSERALMNIAYATNKDLWKFDYTVVWNGASKLANSTGDSINGKPPSYSPEFVTMNFQVTRMFKYIELYGGLENIFDYRQPHPIIGANDPFGSAFDATQVWGPMEGRRIYAGLRYSLN